MKIFDTILSTLAFARRSRLFVTSFRLRDIYVAEDGTIKTTFYLDETLDDRSPPLLTREELPWIAAPEEALNNQASRQSGIFRAGTLLYFLLTDSWPFVGEELPEILHGIAHDQPLAPRSVNADIPEALESVCLRALEKSARRRYARTEDFSEALRCTGLLDTPETSPWWQRLFRR